MIELDFNKGNGLIPVVTQDYKTKEVLMQAYMNKESFNETLKTGIAVYYSRSRNSLWKKGETSGNYQKIKEIRVDCDLDSILLIVDQIGDAACHEGYQSCYYRKVDSDNLVVIGKKIFDPKEVYKK
ncbi:MAG: phosphoribosyl-AMP cyclohydrolase [Spirochaetales bacterium]|nr:phosphoribosyl-AMP cyclohydrolase [Spirochaetales bacterium]